MSDAHAESDVHGDTPRWRRWLYSTNHKDIGTLYLIFSITGGIVGAALSVLIRTELAHPGLDVFADGQRSNVVTTAHGLVMIFFVIMPPRHFWPRPCAWPTASRLRCF